MTIILCVLIYRFERWRWHFDSISIRSISESDLKRNIRRLGFVMTVIDMFCYYKKNFYDAFWVAYFVTVSRIHVYTK